MELHAPHALAFRSKSRILNLFGWSYCRKSFGQSRYCVAVAHPHLWIFGYSFEQRILCVVGRKVCAAVLARCSRFYLSAMSICYVLCSITNAQYRITPAQFAQIDLKSLGVVHAIRRTAQNDSYYWIISFRKLVIGKYFAESVKFTHSAPYQLGCLWPKIKNNYFLLHCFPFVLCAKLAKTAETTPGRPAIKQYIKFQK